MRCITYAGEHLVTSQAIADLVVQLTAALASKGQAEAVQIPIYPEGEEYPGSEDTLEIVQLVIGAGTDVLSVPYAWDGPDPDFADAVTELRFKLNVYTPKAVVSRPSESGFDYELPLDPDPTIF